MKRVLLLSAALLLTSAALHAGPPTFTPSDPDGTPVGVPVDGGASLLLAAGASYGIKRLKEKRQIRKDRQAPVK
jgi:hypothetical protein